VEMRARVMLFHMKKRSLRSRFSAVQGRISEPASCILEVVEEKGTVGEASHQSEVDAGVASLVGELPTK